MKEQKRDKEFDKKIIECVQKNYSFFAWKSLNGVIEKCEMKVKAFRSDYCEMELEAKESEIDKLQNVISGSRKIAIYIPEMAMTFFAPLKNGNEGNRLKVEIPAEYSIHERRKHERVVPQEKCYVSIEVNRQVYKKAIFDISMGGFAIIIPKIERMGIEKDTEISSIILHLVGFKEKVYAKARCTSSFAFDRFKYESLPYGGQKISFCFKDMNMEGKLIVQDFIVSELLVQSTFKQAK